MITAIYRSSDDRTIALPLVEQKGEFVLEIEPGISVPFGPRLNDVQLGLLLLASDIGRREEIVEAINQRMALLEPWELDEFLDRGQFRQMFNSDFADTPLAEVQKFSEELDERISAKCGTEFEFKDFDLGLPEDLKML